ncbi:MAG: right-handed parallel beta-helix repeat-containing protein [Candidatus Bathyarchaeales archaeon]
MPKKKSWKERLRERQIRHQKALEAHRVQREREAEKKPRKWPKGKILLATCLLVLIFGSYAVWQYASTPVSSEETPPPSQETPTQTVPTTEIFIMPNGTVYPSTAPILNVRNSYYKFKADINSSIIVGRDNIIIDGAGYTLQGLVNGTVGIDLTDRYNVTVKNVKIQNFDYGIYLYSARCNIISGNDFKNNYNSIWLYSSSNNTIISNTITDSEGSGITLRYSSNNTISKNKIVNSKIYGVYIGFSTNNTAIFANHLENNALGIFIYSSHNNTIYKNCIENSNSSSISLSSSSKNIVYKNNLTKNSVGISLDNSSDNLIYNNNFLSNSQQVQTAKSANIWSSTADRGNHWSDYQGIDGDQDGIGDTPYVIDENNKDEYPLMKPIPIGV